MLDKNLKDKIIAAQRNEITEYYIYKRLSYFSKNEEQKNILDKIATEELNHAEFFKKITAKDVKPNKFKIFFYFFISRFFGLNFGLKLMEKAEDLAQDVYEKLLNQNPQIQKIIYEEKNHELSLISLINEERLKYLGSAVLGLNDALVELTGALIGFTFALQKTKLVGILGLITGLAGSLSMAASEYLSTKQEETVKNPFRSSIYTGLAYIFTVFILTFPYFFFKNIFLCLFFLGLNMFLVILILTFYIAVVKNLSFKKRFFEMAVLTLTVSTINFFIGILIKKIFGIDI